MDGRGNMDRIIAAYRAQEERLRECKFAYWLLPCAVAVCTWLFTQGREFEDRFFPTLMVTFAVFIITNIILTGKYTKALMGVIVPPLFDEFENVQWELRRKLDHEHHRYGIRIVSSGEMEAHGQVSAVRDGRRFTFVQFFDVPGRKNLGAGYLVTMEYAAPVTAPVVLMPHKGIGRHFARRVKGMQPQTGFADPQFEAMFGVYAHDAAQAQRAMTPERIQAIKRLAQDFSGDRIEMAFTPEKIFLFINTGNTIVPYFGLPYWSSGATRLQKIQDDFAQGQVRLGHITRAMDAFTTRR